VPPDESERLSITSPTVYGTMPIWASAGISNTSNTSRNRKPASELAIAGPVWILMLVDLNHILWQEQRALSEHLERIALQYVTEDPSDCGGYISEKR